MILRFNALFGGLNESSTPMGVPGYTCMSCKERPSVKGGVNWILQIPLMLFFMPFPFDGYCRECGAKFDFVGLLSWVALLGLGFVIAVILYG